MTAHCQIQNSNETEPMINQVEKRLIAILLVIVSLILSAVGCGLNSNPVSVAPLVEEIDQPSGALEVTPFSDVAPVALEDGFEIWNDRPGAVIFDYDRDNDLDIYFTSEGGYGNLLYRNDGKAAFTDVAREAGVALEDSHSTGAVACDFNNDGFQDLYVGAWGNPTDGLGFRSSQQGNVDSLLLNGGDGTFQDITESAFGDEVNIRSATSIACADVDKDGWLDIYVGNLMDEDFRLFEDLNHPGHFNLLFMNNGDLTFEEIAYEVRVRGPQIDMRYPDNEPVLHEDLTTGQRYQGYDPRAMDIQGNRVGEPTGQTHAVLFFDYDDDGDPDLWVANDADRLILFRNDTEEKSNIRFTPVARSMGIDKVGAWMGFAVGDYDGDADLDVYVTNVGFHSLIQPPRKVPRPTCDYFGIFATGTCWPSLLRNFGDGNFTEVAPSTQVSPSPWMPPISLDPFNIDPGYQVPKGLAAYDFGFGATFFDLENDGDQDLYWLGSTLGRGEGPFGNVFPAAGRMMRGDGQGAFEDITVRAHLLDIADVNYDGLENESLARENLDALRSRRIDRRLHENGKGVAHGDLNGDGYVDLVATNSSGDKFVGQYNPNRLRGPTVPAPGPVFLWLNGGGGNNWITLRLKGRMAIDGTGSNADGIGARVYLTTNVSNQEEPRVQVQEVRAGSSYLSMDSLDLEFGLGRAPKVEKIEILWPSGLTQIIENISVNQILTVTEPEP